MQYWLFWRSIKLALQAMGIIDNIWPTVYLDLDLKRILNAPIVCKLLNQNRFINRLKRKNANGLCTKAKLSIKNNINLW